jgi:hypothetical protein
MSKTIKIQKKCTQTVLDSNGRFLYYKLVYPISLDFKLHLLCEEPDEHDFVMTVPVKNKNTQRYFYTKQSENFNKIKAHQYLIMIKASNFKIKKEKEKKDMLVDSYSHYESYI